YPRTHRTYRRERAFGVKIFQTTVDLLVKTLQHLYAEKERLIQAIMLLEGLQQGASGELRKAGLKKRGRKSMGLDERAKVSERMRRYWADRRRSPQPTGLA